MSGFRRLQKVRALMEEAARARVEAEAAQVNRIEQAQAEAAGLTRSMRRDLFAHWSAQPRDRVESALSPGQESSWPMLEAARMLASWDEQQLVPVVEAQRLRLQTVQAEYLTYRQDRQRVDLLLEQERERLALEQGRREQASLDEWYAAKRRRSHRPNRHGSTEQVP